ncbi:MAG: ferritin-like domain-containing protein, partial [Parvularculaceae bacterium]|nr:ferritin-like domain-containing protein [Parvularculaceae bacterium]
MSQSTPQAMHQAKSLRDLYPIPDIDPVWTIPQNFETAFDWEFDEGRKSLMHLYQKGKDMQWDAQGRINWDDELNPDNPMELPDELSGIYHTPIWGKASARERAEMRRHFQAWTISQFLQGEQAAMICAAKIVTQVPDLDAKLYASTQVMDEARHIEAYKKLLEKFGLAYPMTKPLQTLVDQALRDSRWDMTYLAMQVVIEGLALAAFGNIRE